MPTTKEAVDVPQAFTAETEIVPAAAPKLTVIAFELVGVDVIVALGGTDHVQLVFAMLETEYVIDVELGQMTVEPLIAPITGGTPFTITCTVFEFIDPPHAVDETV